LPPLHFPSLGSAYSPCLAGKTEPGAEHDTSRVGYGYGARGAAFKKEYVNQVREGINKTRRRIRSRRNRPTKTRTKSGTCSHIKKHAFEERKTHAQVLD
jgi:hypothetical protein